MERLREAKLSEYMEWLKGYINKGGKPTDLMDMPFSKAKYHTANGVFALWGVRGGVIVLPGGKPHKGELLDSLCFFMDGFEARTSSGKSLYVPVFNDKEFLKIKGVADFIRDAKAGRC